MYTDRIDLSIPQEEIESVLADIASAAATLEFLPTLNPSDRKHLAKLGLKNEGLARRIIEVGRANPGLIPREVEFEKVDRDLLARDQLWELKLVLESILGRVDGALMLTGIDLYAAALEMYHCLRRNADRPGLREIMEDIKKGFARPSRKKKQKPESEPVAAAAPELLAQAPESETVAPERTAQAVLLSEAAVTEPVPAAVPGCRAPISPLSTGAAPSLHFSSQPLPLIFSGGFTPSTLMYVHGEVATASSKRVHGHSSARQYPEQSLFLYNYPAAIPTPASVRLTTSLTLASPSRSSVPLTNRRE